jgi:four helix bundle protein
MTNDEILKNDQDLMTRYSRCELKVDPRTNEDGFWLGESDLCFELREGGDSERVFDLQERTAVYGEAIVRFAKKVPQNAVNNRLVDQLVGAGTSISANYCEADDGVSKSDFRHKIGICRKEARETKFFLRMIATAEPELRSEARALWQEAKELHLIFCVIWRKTL